MHVQVAAGDAQRQRVLNLEVRRGTTARGAINKSALAALFPEMNIAAMPLAIFASPVDDDHELAAGDRVEVLRPLREDPRERRRQLAAEGRTMGSQAVSGKKP